MGRNYDQACNAQGTAMFKSEQMLHYILSCWIRGDSCSLTLQVFFVEVLRPALAKPKRGSMKQA